MDDSGYALYEVKLNRFMNVQIKGNLILALMLALVFVVYAVVNLTAGTFFSVETIALGAGCLIVITVKLFSYPKRLYVTPETVRFQYHTALLTLITTGRIWLDGDATSRYDKNYTLYNIKSIEYFQTQFDKMFSCGHISICGEISTAEGGKEERTFVIYGVKDFENTAEWMKEYIKLSIDT